jgi:aldose 1-epimerase
VAGDQRAVVVGVGGGLRSYEAYGRRILDGYDELELCPSGRGQLLVPWPNRIADGRYEFNDRGHQLPLDEPERENAIHGLVRWSEWTIAERGPDRVALELLLQPRPGYPFTLALRVEHALSPDGLAVEIEATNVGPEPCPYGAGAHPYLALDSGADGAELRLPASTVLEADDRGIPVGRSAVAQAGLDFRQPRRLTGIRLDHCFTELDRDADGRARITVDGTTLWADEAYPYVMAFTGDELPDVARRSIAIEPMTCAPNAFRSGDGLIRLEPGERHSGAWGITPAGESS